MDFFEAQERARTRSRTLVVLFIAAVAAIIAAIYAIVHIALGPGPAGPIDPALLLGVAAGTTLLVAAGSGARTAQLRQGGGRVAELLGGRRVRPGSSDEAERRLINVVEEMAVASGTTVPAIFVLDHEPGINAFAAGYTADDAAVAVTRGALDQLSREELQGVIAHEFSHILNGDMRLNIRLMGLLFGILLLAVVGRGLLHSGARAGMASRGGRRGGNAGQIAILGVALIAVGYIGVFFGRLIQAAVSRQREYLADAAAVQFTRNPRGIAGALAKIGGTGSRLQDHHAQEASHLFFANGIGRAFTSLLATHPPLEDRIRRIDPALDAERRTDTADRAVTGAEPVRTAAATAAAAAASDAGLAGAALMASIGAPQPEHVAYAGRLLDALPPHLRAAAHEPESALPLLFALLLHEPAAAGDAYARQRAAVTQHGGEGLWADTERLAADVRRSGAQARLPLLDILLPALRELSPSQQQTVRATAHRLVAADEKKDMFELAVLHVLGRQLAAGDHAARTAAAGDGGPRSLAPLRDDVELLLSAVAWSGSESESAARDTFAAGAASVQRQTGGLQLQPRSAVESGRIDDALGNARRASAPTRRALLEACLLVIAHDGRVQPGEAELLRAVAEALDLPMPPVAGA
jgi:Zn-dependent protease with chaperone function